MKINRRNFFGAMAATVAASSPAQTANASSHGEDPRDVYGMLCDTTICIGCRKCEFACNREHDLSDRGLDEFEDSSVFLTERWMDENEFTVVNRYENPSSAETPYFVKRQCMHCLDPACVSACLVRALETTPEGAVTYNAQRCMGCRYCMVACPFEVPQYEFSAALTPRVRKCDFCHERIKEGAGIPACAEMCPPMALTFGKRSELLDIAHSRIAADPDRYRDYIYGENEVGGTAWLYLVGKDFDELGFAKLGTKPIPQYTEPIQHAVFKFGLPPLLLFGLLAAVMKTFQDESHGAAEGSEE
jgi:Fe-S-cluster-containing dehydrogenase component